MFTIRNSNGVSERVIMTPPDHFRVENPINPYMNTARQPDPDLARRQWQDLKELYEANDIEVSVLKVDQDLPDSVFASDASLTIGGDTVLAKFKYPQRQPEAEHHRKWHVANTLNYIHEPKNNFEGGDVVKFGGRLLIGHGFRTDIGSHEEISDFLGIPVTSLKLVDPRFYHLDTALSVASAHQSLNQTPKVGIPDSVIYYYPAAFSPESQEIIKELGCKLIEADLPEALNFNLNSMPLARLKLATSLGSQALIDALEPKYIKTYQTDVSEFLKAGGGVKCMTNVLY